MKGKYWIYGLIFFGLLAILAITSNAYTPHDPIHINGNSQFTPQNGVVAGNGTASDPYIIEGWDIDASNANYGIKIENTNAYFIIRNCNVHGAVGYYYSSGVYFSGVTNGKIENCNVYNNFWGIILAYSSNNNITNCNVYNNSVDGIRLWYSSNNTITNCNVYNNHYGIYLWNSSNNNITNCNVYNNAVGIYLVDFSSNNNITNCNVYNNSDGIYLEDSSNNNITNCNIYNNYVGIILEYSSNNNIISNTFTNDGIIILGNSLEHFNTHTIQANTVNGKPLYYYKNESGIIIDNIPVGQLILANCTNFTIKNLSVNNTDIGIELAYSSNNNITNCNVYNNSRGIYLEEGDYYIFGIYLWYSSNNNITNCNVYNNSYGIVLLYSSNNNITNCNAYNNSWCGIGLGASNNNITNCNIYNNSYHGIYLEDSSNNNITNCNVYNNSYGIVLASSSNNNITNCNFYNNSGNGILLYYSSNNNIITNCNVYNNSWCGIWIEDSSNNSILSNFVYNNSASGIWLEKSFWNTISLNSIYNNSDGIFIYNSSNNSILSNFVYNNSEYGIQIEDSSNITIKYNTFTNDGIIIFGYILEYFNTHTIEDNTVNDKALYYYKNEEGYVIDHIPVGELIIANCTNFIIRNLSINNSDIGIEIVFSSNNTITNCNIYNSSNYGIYLLYSSNTEILYNNIYNNTEYGIYNWNTALQYQVNAIYNYWGDASGPYHPTLNPSGLGDKVSDNVIFNPWLTSPYITGNVPPIANNDYYSTSEDVVLIVNAPGVLANDSDVDGDTLTAILVSNPSHGSLILNSNGSFTYTPQQNYYGSDSFTYKAYDGKNYSNIATVYIYINPINDAPVAIDDIAITNEDTSVLINVTANDYDIDGSIDLSSITIIQNPSHGSVFVNLNGTVLYIPLLNYYGSDLFKYKVKDNSSAWSNIATVNITVNPVNDAPNKPSLLNPANGAIRIGLFPILSWQCSDADGDELSYDVYFGTSSPPPKVTTVTTTSYNPGTLSYSTTYYWKIVAKDGKEETSSDIWQFTTIAYTPNQPPICSLNANVSHGYAPLYVNFIMNASDADGSIVSWELDVNNDGIVEYNGSALPSTVQHVYANPGNFTAKLTVRDDKGATNNSTITIIVLQNHKPIVTIITPSNNSEVKDKITIAGKASDEDGNDTLQRVEIKIGDKEWQIANGTLSWKYEWNTKEVENGEYTIKARAYDGIEYSEEATITVKVNNKKGIPGFELIAIVGAIAIILIIKRKR